MPASTNFHAKDKLSFIMSSSSSSAPSTSSTPPPPPPPPPPAPILTHAQSSRPPSRWPNGAKAAISFTMDNLGEAQDVRTGTWPADKPYGTHPAVLETLPRILHLLDDDDDDGSSTSSPSPSQKKIKATYFAETWSLPIYPQTITAHLQNAGHEIAWHGYQHEVWHSLSPDEEASNFQKSFQVSRQHDVVYHGFRPPGGKINGARTLRLCGEYGVNYISPLGKFGIEKVLPPPPPPPPSASGKEGKKEEEGTEKVVVVLPFEWQTVDAFYYMPKFASIRKAHGVQEEPLPPEAFKGYLFQKFDDAVEKGGYISILFHPFLTTSEEKFQVIVDVLERLRGDPDVWVAPCNEVAKWVSEHADEFDFRRL